jgi:acetyltransferase-like isoleucine patch superfamily enzyme
LRKDHRPYFIKSAFMKLQALYSHYYIRPQFDALGEGYLFIHPWNIEIFGSGITIGDHANILTTSDNKVRLTVWPQEKGMGRISIGSYCLICPGVRISSAHEIIIEDNCMLAGSAFITDSDWHGTYDRLTTIGRTAPVHIKDNVWLGDRVTVCKGVTIGENSIIGAGSVVVRDVPPNVIAGGNPARMVKQLDPEQPLVKRQSWFADPDQLRREIDALDRQNLETNTILGWIRTMIKPGIHD